MKIDFHTHSYYSRDGISSPENLIKAALKNGLDGIALTDHNTAKGWKKAAAAAKKLNAVLILGEEILIEENGNSVGEILAYFLKEEINPKGKSIEEIVKEIHKQGGIAIIAHPFNWRKPIFGLEKYKNLVDGIEVFNARSQTKRGNGRASSFAKENNLVRTAGSDAHSSFEVGSAYIEANANNLQELKETILQKKIYPVREYKTSDNFRVIELSNGVKIFGKESPIFVHVFATIGKLIHLFWKPKS